MADTDRHIASVAVNALRLLRRKTLPPVSTTELCDMLVGSLFLPPQYAWFKSVEVYATCVRARVCVGGGGFGGGRMSHRTLRHPPPPLPQPQESRKGHRPRGRQPPRRAWRL